MLVGASLLPDCAPAMVEADQAEGEGRYSSSRRELILEGLCVRGQEVKLEVK